jgi:hypothetical protein
MRGSLRLLDDIIEAAEAQDLKFREENLKNKASLTVGESWMVFHLKLLKELMRKEHDQSQDNKPRP